MENVIPRASLLAACERVLQVRPEVIETVAAKLSQITTPAALEQYRLLLLDRHSIRKLADQTLNVETVITDQNAETLLEEMRRATAKEERAKYDEELAAERKKHRVTQRETKDKHTALVSELEKTLEEAKATIESANAATARLRSDDMDTLRRVIRSVNVRNTIVEWGVSIGLLLLGVLAVIALTTTWLDGSGAWPIIWGMAGIFGLYLTAMEFLGRPRLVLGNLLSSWAAASIRREMRAKRITQISPNEVSYRNGRAELDFPHRSHTS